MPGKVKVRVLSARHLPVMDKSSENTDAFAEVKFGDMTHKTEVYRYNTVLCHHSFSRFYCHLIPIFCWAGGQNYNSHPAGASSIVSWQQRPVKTVAKPTLTRDHKAL